MQNLKFSSFSNYLVHELLDLTECLMGLIKPHILRESRCRNEAPEPVLHSSPVGHLRQNSDVLTPNVTPLLKAYFLTLVLVCHGYPHSIILCPVGRLDSKSRALWAP